MIKDSATLNSFRDSFTTVYETPTYKTPVIKIDDDTFTPENYNSISLMDLTDIIDYLADTKQPIRYAVAVAVYNERVGHKCFNATLK